MRALIIQHENETPAGTTLDWLQEKKIPFEIIMADQADFSLLENFDCLIICGGSPNVDEEKHFPWLVSEKQFIKKTIQSKKKVLGLCLGGQLISECLGAAVKPLSPQKDLWEIGWHDVNFMGSDQKMKAFHWHQYEFMLPVGAKLFASSRLCSHQAYTYQDNVFAFQFHPEVDENWVKLALQDYQPPVKGDIQSASEILKYNPEYLLQAKAWYFQFLDRFLG